MADYTYDLDLDAKTVIAIDSRGESHDLHADGEPCTTWDELGGLVRELETQGAITPDV